MNVNEGARRIKSIGRYMLFASLGVFGLLICLLVTALLLPALEIHFAMIELVVLPMIVAVPGASLYLIAWIVEGFAKAAH